MNIPNEILEELSQRFQIAEQPLGRGGMGTVIKVKEKGSGEIYALKIVNQFENIDAERMFLKEASVWFELRMIPQVVQVHEIIKIGSSIGILMEYVSSGTLRDRLDNNNLSLDEALLALYDICEALHECSTKFPDFAHLDIKPQNCLMTAYGLTKLSDFGLAQIYNDKHSEHKGITDNDYLSIPLTELSFVKIGNNNHCVGTPYYMAPEQFNGSCENGIKADIYSFGILALELLNNKHPYESLDPNAIISNIRNGIERKLIIYPEGLDKSLSRLLSGCVHHYPANRPSTAQVTDSLKKVLFFKRGIKTTTSYRIYDFDDDTIRSCNSLCSLGLVERARNVVASDLEANPFSHRAWFKMMVLLYQTTKDRLTDKEINQLFVYACRYNLLNTNKDMEDIEPNDLKVYGEILKNVFHNLKQDYINYEKEVQVKWLQERYDKLLSHKLGHRRCLCIKCGALKSFILDRCAKCGFNPMRMKDIFYTYIHQVAFIPGDGSMIQKQNTLIIIGKNIRHYISEIEKDPELPSKIRNFEASGGKKLWALANEMSLSVSSEHKGSNILNKVITGVKSLFGE